MQVNSPHSLANLWPLADMVPDTGPPSAAVHAPRRSSQPTGVKDVEQRDDREPADTVTSTSTV